MSRKGVLENVLQRVVSLERRPVRHSTQSHPKPNVGFSQQRPSEGRPGRRCPPGSFPAHGKINLPASESSPVLPKDESKLTLPAGRGVDVSETVRARQPWLQGDLALEVLREGDASESELGAPCCTESLYWGVAVVWTVSPKRDGCTPNPAPGNGASSGNGVAARGTSSEVTLRAAPAPRGWRPPKKRRASEDKAGATLLEAEEGHGGTATARPGKRAGRKDSTRPCRHLDLTLLTSCT